VLRAIVFDFNGVLVDDEPLHYRLFRRVLEEEDLSLSEEDYYDRYLGLDDRGCFREVLEAAGRDASPLHLMRLIARKAAYYGEEIHRSGFPFFPGAVDLVRSCTGRGWMLAVVSGALRDEVEGALAQEGLRRHFKVLVTAEDVERTKPDPEGYRKALEGLNALPPLPERLLHPHEVAALEDSPAGLEAAAGAGLRTVGVAHTYGADRLGPADAVVNRVEELDADRLEDLLAATR
jgi:beta-phosphoglucomutase